MSIIFIMIIVSAIGLGTVGWIILRDGNSGGMSVEKLEPDQVKEFATGNPFQKKSPKNVFSFLGRPANRTLPISSIDDKQVKKAKDPSVKKSTPFNLFGQLTKTRLDRTDKKPSQVSSEPEGISELKDFILSEEKKSNDPQHQSKTASTSTQQSSSGTASLTTHHQAANESSIISKDEQKNIDQEIELSLQVNELKEKNDRLEKLLKEKNDELEKNLKSLNNELKDSKEFNKVKDLLEKEIKETKDKNREVKSELASLQLESDNYKKRTLQLEEKIKYLDKEVLGKDNENVELLNRLKVLQTASRPQNPTIAPPEQTKNQNTDAAPSKMHTPVLSKSMEPVPASNDPAKPETPQLQPPEQLSEINPGVKSEQKNIPLEPNTDDVTNTVSDQQETPNTDTSKIPDKPKEGGEFLKLPPDPASLEKVESGIIVKLPEKPEKNTLNNDNHAPKI